MQRRPFYPLLFPALLLTLSTASAQKVTLSVVGGVNLREDIRTTTHSWRPFLEAGPSFRAEGNRNLEDASNFGVTAGTGLEFRVPMVRISPMVRYTYWGPQQSGARPRTWPSQTQVLVSVVF